MSQADITRLVVGEPFTLGMGRAVGQSLRTSDVSKSLQWRDGKWQGQKSLLSTLTKKKRPKLLVLPAGAGRRLRFNAWVIAALVGLAGTGVALGLLLQSREAPLASNAQPAAAQSLPFVQAPDNVRTVDQPFPTAPSESFQVIQTAEGEAPTTTAGTPSLPILAPAGVGTTTTASSAGASLPFVAPAPMPTPIGPAPELTSERSNTRADARPPAKPAKEEPKPPTVILDEMEDKPQPSAAAKPEARSKSSQSSKPSVVASSAATPAAAPSAPAAPALSPARGLIAITPDGKSAVFTDPATRLPKQFKVGDKLTGGDTIKSIDAAQGKVIAGTKEYSLD